jgi:polar amino acid transport system permease protein
VDLSALPILSELYNSWPLIIGGLVKTIILSSVVTVNGLLGGVLVFWLTLSRNRIVQGLTQGYIALLIGTPLIVFLFLLYYGLPGLGVTLSPFTIAAIGFFFNVSAYNARYLSSAFKGLNQTELQAARAQGFSEFQVFHLITAPQAIRMSVPSLTNQAILNIKDSSIVFLIQYTEFFAQMQEIAMSSFLFFEAYVFTALVYLLLVSIIVIAARWIEASVNIPRT